MTTLRPDVRRAALVGTIAATAMIAGVVGAKATRDALFLDAFAASQLPTAMLIAAGLSVGAVVLSASLIARVGPHRFTSAAFALHAVAFAVEYALLELHPKAVAGALYLHVASLGSLLVSGFWSLVSERFDPHSAKKIMGRLNAGATSGGLLGGGLAELVAKQLDARSMLLVLGGLAAFCAGAVGLLGRGMPHLEREPSRFGAGESFERAPYLRQLAALVLVIAIMSGLVDYAFKATAQEHHGSREALMSFFALFYTGSALLTFVLQASLGKKLLDRFGLGTTIALLPAAVLVGGTVSVLVPRLWTVVLARGSESVLVNSWYRSGYELLFTPVPPKTKRPTKTFIDVGFDRLGTAIASGVILALLAVAPGSSTRLALAGSALAAAVALVVASRLHRGYVDELAQSLKSGRVALTEGEVVDATTRRTLADTTMAIDRGKLLAEIEELRRSQDDSEDDGSELRVEVAFAHELQETIDDLLSGDAKRVRRALRPPVDPRAMGLVMTLLGDPSFGRSARRVLRRAASRDAGQMVDAILDEAVDPAVRRRLPAIVASAPSARNAALLSHALEVHEPEVRSRVVSALQQMAARDSAYAPDPAVVFRLIRRALDDDDVSLPQVFELLELVLEPEAVRLSLHALQGDDPRLRGTSMEYLDNVLPEEIRTPLLPHLLQFGPPSQRSPTARRSRKELEQALLQSSDSIHLPRASVVDDRDDSLAPPDS